MGKGTGGASKTLESIGKESNEAFRPVRDTSIDQIMNILLTGGSGVGTPLVQRAVEGTKQAVSRELGGIDEQLAALGITDSSAGQRIKAESRVQGAGQVAGVPTQVSQQLLSMLMPVISGLPTIALQGLGAAAQSDASAKGNQLGLIGQLAGAGATAFAAR